MRNVLGAVIALSAPVVFSFGCGSSGPPASNSFTEVYTRTIQPTCSSNFCHYNSVGIRYSGLDMSSQVRAYWSLVGQPSIGPNCYKAGMGMRVIPGDPDNSIMYQKLSATTLACGSQMPADTHQLLRGIPVFSGNAVPTDQVQLIHDWIEQGAQDN